MICLNSEGLFFLDQLKTIRAITMEDLKKKNFYNHCLENEHIYDDNGKFIPYSTIVHTIEEHKILCEHYSERRLKREQVIKQQKVNQSQN